MDLINLASRRITLHKTNRLLKISTCLLPRGYNDDRLEIKNCCSMEVAYQ